MPLAKGQDIDLIVVRENSEGEYCNNGGRFKKGTPHEIAVQSAVHTRLGVQRILEYGFELAMSEGRRKRLTMITKSNAQTHSMVMWDDILDEISLKYPEVVVDKQHVDAASMNFVLRPESFDVVVASNLYGDILSDLSGAITGSLGLNPSANLDPTRKYPSLFEPVHGSAPDIAGKVPPPPPSSLPNSSTNLYIKMYTYGSSHTSTPRHPARHR
jgi:tartrate dehydrogenase/decarboxylase/D-malate dehydrogenase